MGKSGELTLQQTRAILKAQKQKERKIVLTSDKIRQYFSDEYDDQRIEELIYQLLEEWHSRT